MAQVNLPFTLTNGTTAEAPEVQANDDALRDGVNNVDNTQIDTDTILDTNLNVTVSPVTRFPEIGGQNFVVDGSTWITTTTSVDLNYTVPSFVSYVQGVRVSNAGFARLYTASRDTYIDQDNAGVLTFSEVSNGASAPVQAGGTLRLLKVETDGVQVVDVVTLARDSAFDTSFQAELRDIQTNLDFDTGSSETPGNQTGTVVYRGRDSTGNFILNTGTSGVDFDSALKQVVGGMDQNIVLTAAAPINVWIIASQDQVQPIGAILSYEAAPFGDGSPILPAGYDVFVWVGMLMTTPSPAKFIPSSQNGLITRFYENVKNVFVASQNGTWHTHSFSPNFALSDHVGAVLLKCLNFQDESVGYANFSVTGVTKPQDQDGATIINYNRNIFAQTGEGWVPLNPSGQAKMYHDNVTDGTGATQQGGRRQPDGAGLYGWEYKHF